MLEKQVLWLTDLRYMNDSHEMSHGLRYVIASLSNPVLVRRVNPQYVDSALKFVQGNLEFEFAAEDWMSPIFSCSFSRAEDLLSQWRAYGNYAIEFEVDDSFPDLSECVYEDKEKSTLAFETTIQTLRHVGRSHIECDGGLDETGHSAYSDLVKTAARFKHKSFAEEQEYRMIRGTHIMEMHDVLYRAKGSMLVPYIEVAFPFESIKAIHVGPMPNQNLAFNSMQMFAAQIDYDWNNRNPYKDHSIDVVRSDIPYRATI
jgi:hypothetical protein